jgi:hypothetical protein
MSSAQSSKCKQLTKEVEVATKTANKILSLNEILAVEDVTERTVPVPQWGGSVVVRSITKRQMKEIKEQSRDNDGELQEDLVEKAIFMHGLINPEVDEAGYEKLLDKSAAAVDTITKAILESSKLTEDSVKKSEKQFRNGQR